MAVIRVWTCHVGRTRTHAPLRPSPIDRIARQARQLKRPTLTNLFVIIIIIIIISRNRIAFNRRSLQTRLIFINKYIMMIRPHMAVEHWIHGSVVINMIYRTINKQMAMKMSKCKNQSMDSRQHHQHMPTEVASRSMLIRMAPRNFSNQSIRYIKVD